MLKSRIAFLLSAVVGLSLQPLAHEPLLAQAQQTSQRIAAFPVLKAPCAMTPNPASAPFHTGSGTPADPYFICTAQELMAINNSAVHLTKYFKVGATIDMQGQSFSGIGAFPSSPFTGSFDGQDFNIVNMTLGTGSQSDLGLFNYISNGAVIKRVNLQNVVVSGASNVGALVGRAQTNAAQLPVDIQDCTVTGTVGGQLTVGGLVGFFSHTSSNPGLSRLRESASTAAVTATLNTVGGLIGRISGAKASLETSNASGATRAPSRVGGLVGSADTNFSIADVYFIGSPNLVGLSANQVGGLIGLASTGTLLRSYATGSINANDSIGGLIGDATAMVVQQSFTNMPIQGFSNSGGLIGISRNNVNVQDSYTRGNVSCSINCGGLVGDIEITLPGTTYARVYATGFINPADDTSVCFAHNAESGALFGEINPVATITSNKWNTQTSGQCTAAGNLDPLNDVGTPLTTAQMGNVANFSGWNFTAGTGVWEMPVGGPPRLQWE